jgi:hypothetical protein
VGVGVGVVGVFGVQAIITIMMFIIDNITHPCLRMMFIGDLLSLCEIDYIGLIVHYVTIIHILF